MNQSQILKSNKEIQQEREKIEVIAHRGLSSIFPQNTLQAIIAGLHFSDYTQIDVLLTKDQQIIVFHDRGLKRITDVKNIQEFKDRAKSQALDGLDKVSYDWWVRDFSFAQLQRLKVRQPIEYRPQLPQVFKISRLQQVLQQCIKQKNRKQLKNKLKSGLLIELKSQTVDKTCKRDLILCEKVIEALKKFNLHTKQGCRTNNLQIIIQSFNIDMIEYIQDKCQNEFVQLYKQKIQINEQLLKNNYSSRVKGIGITEKNLQNSFKKDKNSIIDLCDKFKYKLYYWTIRDDEQNIPFCCKNYQQLYKKLRSFGVTGFITEFPDKCRGIFKIESTQFSMDKEQIAQKCPRNQYRLQQKIKTQQALENCDSKNGNN